MGEKIGITGANGVGKSTLLKLLIGELSADKGSIDWLPNLEVGYLEQHFKMDNTLTVYECLKSAFENLYAAEQKLWTLYQLQQCFPIAVGRPLAAVLVTSLGDRTCQRCC